LLLQPCEFLIGISIGISVGIWVVAGANFCNGLLLFELCVNGRAKAVDAHANKAKAEAKAKEGLNIYHLTFTITRRRLRQRRSFYMSE